MRRGMVDGIQMAKIGSLKQRRTSMTLEMLGL